MHRFILLAVAALSLLSMQARAGIAINGQKLLSWCESEKAEDLAVCQGYILSVGDILDDQTVFKGRACLPQTTTGDELRKLVLLFLKANPQLLEKASGANLAALAMMHAYPCKEGS